MSRCKGYTDKGKRCRTRICEKKLFCCDSHKPINYTDTIEECPICYATIHETDPNSGYVLRCNHMFHYSCIQEWFKSSTWRRMCPMCRLDVSPPNKKDRY